MKLLSFRRFDLILSSVMKALEFLRGRPAAPDKHVDRTAPKDVPAEAVAQLERDYGIN
jgi:hypothetical protein